MMAILLNGSQQGPGTTWADESPKLLDPTAMLG